jgi:PAS domain-containing protein
MNPVTIEHIHHDAQGREVPVEVIAAPVFDENGEVIQIIESARNITFRKLAERDLRASEERFRDIFDNAHDLIQCIKSDGTFSM